MSLPPITYGSVCSGIEAASVAWHPLGWQPAWLAEVDAAASRVLAFRFPEVANLGDMTAIAASVRSGEVAAPDVLVGGTPCQSFSVAGLRRGLADARGQLTIAYIDLANAIDEARAAAGKPPCIIVWENVPGVLNHKDNPFGCFLAGLAGESDELVAAGRRWTDAGCVFGPQRAIAWRIKDAQYLGLAQRRRRVFVVASAREGFDPAAVLPEFDGVRRDTPPSREPGQGVTHATAPCLTSSGRGVERTGNTRGQDPVVDDSDDGVGVRRAAGLSWPAEVASTLNAHFGEKQGLEDQHVNSGCPLFVPVAFSSKDYGADAASELAPTLRASGHDESHANGGSPPAVAYAIQERAVAENPLSGPDGVGVRADDCAYTLEARSVPQAVGHAVEVLPFDTTQITCPNNYSKPQAGGTGHPLAAGAHPPAICVTEPVTHALKADGFDGSEDGTGRGQPIVCHGTQDPCVSEAGLAFTMGRNGGGENDVLATQPVTMAVRRLMPVECERLQGFPDNWTLVPVALHKHRKVTKARPDYLWAADPGGEGWWLLAADGPRYKQLGNSMAVPCMRWIGRRVAAQLGTLIGHNGGPPLDDEFSALLPPVDEFAALAA